MNDRTDKHGLQVADALVEFDQAGTITQKQFEISKYSCGLHIGLLYFMQNIYAVT